MAIMSIVFYFLWPALLVIYLGGLLAFALNPLYNSLIKHKVPKGLSAIFCIIFFLSLVYLFLIMLLPALYEQIHLISQKLTHFNIYTPSFIQHYISNEQIAKYSAMAKQSIINNLDFIGGYIFNILSAQSANIVLFAGKFYLTLIIAFFILKDWHKFNQLIKDKIPSKYSSQLINLFGEIMNSIKQLLHGQIIIVSILIIFYTISFYIFNLSNPLLFGIFAGLASFVPYVGMIVMSLFTFIYAINHNPQTYQLIGIIGTFVAGNALESSLLVPVFLSQKLSIHPIILLFYMITLGNLFGIGGIILALPTAAVLNVLVKFGMRKFLKVIG